MCNGYINQIVLYSLYVVDLHSFCYWKGANYIFKNTTLWHLAIPVTGGPFPEH